MLIILIFFFNNFGNSINSNSYNRINCNNITISTYYEINYSRNDSYYPNDSTYIITYNISNNGTSYHTRISSCNLGDFRDISRDIIKVF